MNNKVVITPAELVIAGAGIAGLSAAIALRLAGFSVAIFEREEALKEVGAGIKIGPSATRIMESWELDLLGSSVEPESIELRNAISGASLNRIPLRRAARARYGSPYLTLLRADVQKALLNRAKELEIRDGCRRGPPQGCCFPRSTWPLAMQRPSPPKCKKQAPGSIARCA